MLVACIFLSDPKKNIIVPKCDLGESCFFLPYIPSPLVTFKMYTCLVSFDLSRVYNLVFICIFSDAWILVYMKVTYISIDDKTQITA